MGTSLLEGLSNELFEQIIQLLSFADIKSLRLVSRSTASKAAQDTHRSFFKTKHVELRREHLQAFVRITPQGGMGCFVEHLSLVAIVYDPRDLKLRIESGKPPRRPGSSRKVERSYTAEELEAAKEDLAALRLRRKQDEALRGEATDLDLLRKAFSNLALSKHGKPLKGLSLCIKIHRGDTIKPRPTSLWRSKQVFRAAIDTYRLATDSLRHSQLRIQALDVFFDIPEQVDCSLPCDTLGTTEHFTWLEACLAPLQTFSLSITDPLLDEIQHETHEEPGQQDQNEIMNKRYMPENVIRDRISSEKNYSALSSPLRLCPNLEELNIVGHRFEYSEDSDKLVTLQKIMRTRHMQYLARCPSFPKLRKLYMAGLSIHATDLLPFLISHTPSLREIDITEITILPNDSFPRIASYITGEETQLEAIRLENNHSGNKAIHFHCDWEREGIKWPDRDIVRMWGVKRKADMEYMAANDNLFEWVRMWEWTLEEKVVEEKMSRFDLRSVLLHELCWLVHLERADATGPADVHDD